jgi:hypothetical protein
VGDHQLMNANPIQAVRSTSNVGVKMRKILKTGAAALMLTCMAGNVWAATARVAECANPADMYAVRTAAIQQKLMVAALSCHSIEVYNKFVTSYRTDLQASDRHLQDFFRRLYGPSGTANYHSFKTRLANSSSLESLNDPGYCVNAQATFDAALENRSKSLTVFISDRPTEAERAFSQCEVITASTKRAPHNR